MRERPSRAAVVRAARLGAVPAILIVFLVGALGVRGGGGASSAAAQPDSRQSANCVVNPKTMTSQGCLLMRTDAAGFVNPAPGLWGDIECAAASRQRRVAKGGDTHRRADGKKQGNTAYRRLTVFDGDDYYGERCELGRNERRNGENTGSQTSGTFALYGQDEHRITFFSERYPAGFPSTTPDWQTIMQMKQTEPYADTDVGVALSLQLFGGRLRLYDFDTRVWSIPAPRHGIWIRYALDVVYSTDPAIGSIKVYVDSNGDGDALDKGEQSPRMHMATLASDPTTGGPLPDHLRIGIYHNPAISCPRPAGCSVDVDNVQVVG